MRLIGFSTGALARNDFRRALQMLAERRVRAVELSALRQDELIPLVEQLDDLDLRVFEYKAFHAPSLMDGEFESVAISALEQVALREWPIIVHPDAMHIPAKWARFGDLLCIENMDKRKPIGQTVTDLADIFGALPRASLCFDIGHAPSGSHHERSGGDSAALRHQTETASRESGQFSEQARPSLFRIASCISKSLAPSTGECPGDSREYS
jgi:hypothetical protein